MQAQAPTNVLAGPTCIGTGELAVSCQLVTSPSHSPLNSPEACAAIWPCCTIWNPMVIDLPLVHVTQPVTATCVVLPGTNVADLTKKLEMPALAGASIRPRLNADAAAKLISGSLFIVPPVSFTKPVDAKARPFAGRSLAPTSMAFKHVQDLPLPKRPRRSPQNPMPAPALLRDRLGQLDKVAFARPSRGAISAKITGQLAGYGRHRAVVKASRLPDRIVSRIEPQTGHARRRVPLPFLRDDERDAAGNLPRGEAGQVANDRNRQSVLEGHRAGLGSARSPIIPQRRRGVRRLSTMRTGAAQRNLLHWHKKQKRAAKMKKR